jgi:hypothetical protein
MFENINGSGMHATETKAGVYDAQWMPSPWYMYVVNEGNIPPKLYHIIHIAAITDAAYIV